MELFIVTSNYYEPLDGPFMGTDIEGVFSTLELAKQCINDVKNSEEYNDYHIITTLTVMHLDDTTFKEIVEL